VSEHLRGKQVAIVGSGPGSLDNEAGFVDSHEVVVRVNNWKTNRNSGRRTDVFYSFFGSSIKKTAAEAISSGVRLCMCKCPNAKVYDSEWHRQNNKLNGTDFRYIYEKRARWWFCDTYVPTVEEFMRHFDLLGGHVATTGFSALLDVLSYEPASVFMTGFDFFTSGIHNVNERWKPGDPSDPIGHVPATEARWLKDNAPSLPITMDQRLKKTMWKLG
jgi:hypothetical protein